MARPQKYTEPEQLQKKVDAYFVRCDGEIMTDEDGNPIVIKTGYLYKPGKEPKAPSVSGLQLWLGFSSQQTMLDYVERGNRPLPDKATKEEKQKWCNDREIMEIFTRAKLKIQTFVEGQLFARDGSNGAKFWLASQSKGWSDKQDVNVNSTINVVLKDDTDD